jgi:hypothetical protein
MPFRYVYFSGFAFALIGFVASVAPVTELFIARIQARKKGSSEGKNKGDQDSF